MTLSSHTLSSLESMPERLSNLLGLVPRSFRNWQPLSWEGIPGERFGPLGQVCHLRDIEIDGYHVRIARLLSEEDPKLTSLDGYRLASERDYEHADLESALEAFRVARSETLGLLQGLGEAQLSRVGSFGEYGRISLRSLVHYLASHDLQHLASLEWLLGQIHAP